MLDTKEKLTSFDERIYEFLKKRVDIMPMRLVKLIANYYTDARVRKLYFRRLGVVMGENTYTNLGFRIASNDFEDRVFIGKNVSIAPNVTIVVESTANNGQEINEIPYLKQITGGSKVVIEDEVWIGASVTILPDVTIGRCSVIGAGSVVTEDVEPYSVYVGAPARKIRDLKTGARTLIL